MKKILLYLTVFFIIGELFIRFDESFTVLEENRIVKMATSIELTPEYKLLKNNNFIFNDKDLRIMVIGDSYIHGGGIEFKDNFSQQLKKFLSHKNKDNSKVWILDVSKSSSNNLDNNETYFNFVNQFKPNIVILGYNLNDIEGELDKQNKIKIEKIYDKKVHRVKNKSTIQKVYKIIQTSHLVRYIVRKIHRELNTFGIIFPNSKFDINMKSYYQDKEVWKKSKVLLDEIIQDSNKRNIKLLVYKFANISEYPELFSKADKSVKDFFTSFSSVIYVDGNDYFKVENAKEYRLSKYDGHPNEKAHKIMAKAIFDIIKPEI